MSGIIIKRVSYFILCTYEHSFDPSTDTIPVLSFAMSVIAILGLSVDVVLGSCFDKEHQVPVTIYAFSANSMRGVSFKIGDIPSSSDLIYYDSNNELFDRLEFTKTVCVDESDLMSYTLTVNAYGIAFRVSFIEKKVWSKMWKLLPLPGILRIRQTCASRFGLPRDRLPA